MQGGLGNLTAAAIDQLTAIIKNRLKSIEYRPGLIDGFLAETGLSLAAWLIQIARGHSGQPYDWLAATGGLACVAAWHCSAGAADTPPLAPIPEAVGS